MVRYGLVIDLDRCIGCQTCVIACKLENNVGLGNFWNRVLTIGGLMIDVSRGEYPNTSISYLPVTCQHCENAPCVKACPVNATYRRPEDGTIQIRIEKCIGCRYCMAACPYGVRVFNWGEPKHIPEHPVGFQGEVKDEGWVIYTPKRPRGVVEKCTMCIHRIIVGEEPFCVAMCPARARFFGDLDNPNSKVSRLIKERSGVRLLEELGTQPKTYYLPPRRGRQAFANIDEIVAEYVKSTLTNIVVTSKDIALQAIAASTLKRVSNNV